MKKILEAYGVFAEGGADQLLIHDPVSSGLGFHYPTVFKSKQMADSFAEQHSRRKGEKFSVKRVTIKVGN